MAVAGVLVTWGSVAAVVVKLWEGEAQEAPAKLVASTV